MIICLCSLFFPVWNKCSQKGDRDNPGLMPAFPLLQWEYISWEDFPSSSRWDTIVALPESIVGGTRVIPKKALWNSSNNFDFSSKTSKTSIFLSTWCATKLLNLPTSFFPNGNFVRAKNDDELASQPEYLNHMAGARGSPGKEPKWSPECPMAVSHAARAWPAVVAPSMISPTAPRVSWAETQEALPRSKFYKMLVAVQLGVKPKG